jgi:hypothetical protein
VMPSAGSVCEVPRKATGSMVLALGSNTAASGLRPAEGQPNWWTRRTEQLAVFGAAVGFRELRTNGRGAIDKAHMVTLRSRSRLGGRSTCPAVSGV